MSVVQIRIIHWKPDEINSHIQRLRRAGFGVSCDPENNGRNLLRSISQNTPDVIIVDISRLPSQGRDLGVHFRRHGKTRFIPLLFTGGSDENRATIKKILPDVTFVGWSDVIPAIKMAMENPQHQNIVPDSVFVAYQDKNLTEKLGIRENFRVCLFNNPRDFIHKLIPLPKSVEFVEVPTSNDDLVIWFVREMHDLKRGLTGVCSAIGDKPLWIVWPKKSGALKSDLTQNIIRENGFNIGLVDYKICSVDHNWSGLLFRPRKDKKR